MAKMQVLNPRAPAPRATLTLRPLDTLRESRAGVLRNQKQHAGLLMVRIIEELSAKHGVIKNMEGERPTASPANPAQLDEFARSCDWVITGSAD